MYFNVSAHVILWALLCHLLVATALAIGDLVMQSDVLPKTNFVAYPKKKLLGLTVSLGLNGFK